MISQLYVEIGERIRSKRLALHLTQAQLSEKIGISDNHMSEIERGNDRLSYDKLLRLCEIFDCSTDYILRGCNTIEDGVEIPESIIEVFRKSDSKEIALFEEYIRLYSKIRNFNPQK